jgi:tetratricopeptide (TPR) repeat protein
LDQCVPKITDFGLAKLVVGGGEGQTPTGAVLGTPGYMAPEQAGGRAKDIGPAADVYALGAILYEMLTGRPPFRGETPLDTLQQVVSAEPVPPRRLQPKVPRDLETICLKCLGKEPKRRYASAEALAEDLARFQSGEPIRARPAPVWERLIKWARRRPLAAALAGVSSLAVVAVVATLTISNVRISQEKQRAQDNYRVAQANFEKALDAVEQMLTRVGHDRLAAVPHMEHVRRRLLEDAQSFLEGFLRERGTEPAVRAAAGRVHRLVADIYTMLGKNEEADARYRRAREVLARLGAEDAPVPAYRYQLSVARHNHGRLLFSRGKFPEAKEALDEAQVLLTGLAADFPDVPGYRRDLGNNLLRLGDTLDKMGRPADVARAYRQAQSVLAKLVNDFPEKEDYRFVLAATYHNAGYRAHQQGRAQEAERLYRRAWQLNEQILGRSPDVPLYRRDQGNTEMYLGLLLATNGRYPEAEKLLGQARERLAKLNADFPAVPEYQHLLANVHHHLGRMFRDSGQLAEAVDALRQATGLLKQVTGQARHVPLYRDNLANNYGYLGFVLAEADRLPEAVESMAQARALYDQLVRDFPKVPEYQFQRAGAYHNSGEPLYRLRRYPEAVAAFQESRRILEQLREKDPGVPAYRRDLANTWMALGKAWRAQDKPRQTAEAFQQSLALWKGLVKQFPDDTHYRMALAGTRAEMGDHAEAAREAEDLIKRIPDRAVGCYQAACIVSVCVSAVAKDTDLPEAQRLKLEQQYRERALAMLRDAVKEGFRGRDLLRKDPDLEPLRAHADFQKLLSELGERAKQTPK